MAMGQGASMALPIYGKFMQKVYADPTLPYKQDAKFTFPRQCQPLREGNITEVCRRAGGDRRINRGRV